MQTAEVVLTFSASGAEMTDPRKPVAHAAKRWRARALKGARRFGGGARKARIHMGYGTSLCAHPTRGNVRPSGTAMTVHRAKGHRR